jgi:hypothetical protein
MAQYAQWNQHTGVNDDRCTVKVGEAQSQRPNSFVTSNFYRPCETSGQYAINMTEPGHQYSVQGPSQCNIAVDSQLRYATMTNQGQMMKQMYTRPYVAVPYMGSGQNCAMNKDVESRLIYAEDTTQNKPCEYTSGATISRYLPLPDYGNPQRYTHVIPPWVNGGENSREYIRNVNFVKFCANKQNTKLANKVPVVCTNGCKSPCYV